MDNEYNIYCDESCHLENDNQKAMSFGALQCPKDLAKEYNYKLAQLKYKHKYTRYCECKWTKVSNSNLEYYIDLVNFFFDKSYISFRSLIIPDKSALRHEDFLQTHDEFYYKSYYYLLDYFIDSEKEYYIYLDKKDTRSRLKTIKLHEVLCNSNRDFNREIIKSIQTVTSDQINLLQLADLLLGAVSFTARGLEPRGGKKELLEVIKARSGISLKTSTTLGSRKFNLFYWNAQTGGSHG